MNKTLFVSTTQRSVIQFMNKPSDWKRIIKQENALSPKAKRCFRPVIQRFCTFFQYVLKYEM